MFFARPLNILSLGDDYARSLGLNVNMTRFILLVLSSIMAGFIVSFCRAVKLHRSYSSAYMPEPVWK